MRTIPKNTIDDIADPRYMVLISPDFKLTKRWTDQIEKRLNVKIINEDELHGEKIEIALVDDSINRRLGRYPNLKIIFSLSAGVESLLNESGLPDVPIVRLINKEMSALMREYVCYFAIKLHRDFFQIEKNQERKTWQWLPPQKAANSCRVSILGLGHLGLPTAKALKMLGFKVSGWSYSPKKVLGIRCLTGKEGLEVLLPETDILICLLPLTAATKELLDSDLFHKLPQGACVINASRAGCIKESDLLSALKSRQLSKAVLDVFNEEPIPPSADLWNNPHVIITPHMASYPEPQTFLTVIESSLKKYLNGEIFSTEVNKEAGY